MSSKIFVISTNMQPDGSFSVSGVFWLTAPANGVIPLPTFQSAVLDISEADQLTLQAGTVVELSFNSGLLPVDTQMSDIRSLLEGRYSDAQTTLDASNPTISGLIGATFDGYTWSNASAPSELWLKSRVPQLNPNGVLKTQDEPRVGNKVQLISQNFCDKHTWYSTSVRRTDQAMSDAGGGVTFVLASDKVGVDVNHGRILHERRLRDTYSPVVKADGTAMVEKDPHDNSGDYTIDYATMRITFSVSQTGKAVIMDFSEVVNSKWYVKPTEGKLLRLINAELQFSADAKMDDSFIFQPRGDVAKFAPFAPYCTTNGGPYPPGTMLPAGDPTCYQTIFDLVCEANLSYPAVPAIKHDSPTWRDTLNNIYIFSWDYGNQATVNITDGAGDDINDIEISLEHDVEMAGSQAVVTFYCLSESVL